MRQQNIIPGVLYGPTIKNETIMATKRELQRVTSNLGEVYEVNSDRGTVYVKFDEIQKDPVTKEYIHFSLVQLPKGVENDVDVPLTFSGTPTGAKHGGTLVIIKDELTLTGKPSDMPHKISGDTSKLEIGDKLTIKDLKLPKGVTTTESEDEVIAVCMPPVKEEDLITDTTVTPMLDEETPSDHN